MSNADANCARSGSATRVASTSARLTKRRNEGEWKGMIGKERKRGSRRRASLPEKPTYQADEVSTASSQTPGSMRRGRTAPSRQSYLRPGQPRMTRRLEITQMVIYLTDARGGAQYRRLLRADIPGHVAGRGSRGLGSHVREWLSCDGLLPVTSETVEVHSQDLSDPARRRCLGCHVERRLRRRTRASTTLSRCVLRHATGQPYVRSEGMR